MVGATIFIGLLALTELGYHGARWQHRRRGAPPETTDNGRDHLLAAMLGLMALLLGFTFSLTLNRFETRSSLVVQEANALTTAWTHTQVLKEPDREAVTSALRDYVAIRGKWSESYAGREGRASTEQMQQRLWNAATTAARNEPSLAVSRGLTEAISASFDTATARLAARTTHVPDLVLNVLLLCMALAMVVLGEVVATRKRHHRVSTGLLLLLLTLVVAIILDLDRTDSGTIMVSQQPLLDLHEALR
jgi:hypothetical protein